MQDSIELNKPQVILSNNISNSEHSSEIEDNEELNNATPVDCQEKITDENEEIKSELEEKLAYDSKDLDYLLSLICDTYEEGNFKNIHLYFNNYSCAKFVFIYLIFH